MSGKIFNLRSGNQLDAMDEINFDTEAEFQELLEDHHELLAGDQINCNSPRRWLLIKREMGIAESHDAVDRWSVDHLFIDQDGIPTLVEVKRSTDTRLRREVVGQLLDYAANAVVHWSLDNIKSKFNQQCESSSKDHEAELEEFLSDLDTDPNAFWEAVKTNLQAGKIRLLFVANSIPPELRRIVEFMNEQMDPAEVLAVEIRKFKGPNSITLVPTVTGHPKAGPNPAMKFTVTINGIKRTNQAKHRAVHHFVKALAAEGHSPEKIDEAIAWKKLLIKIPPEQSGETVEQRLRSEAGVERPEKDWLIAPKEIIEFEDKQYAVSRKFFDKTPKILEVLMKKFQPTTITFERES